MHECTEHSRERKWAATCDFQQCGVLTSVDSDEPVQLPVKLRISKQCSVSKLNSHRIFKWLAKALIRLHICARWSEALLVAHTTLLKISCRGSNSSDSDSSLIPRRTDTYQRRDSIIERGLLPIMHQSFVSLAPHLCGKRWNSRAMVQGK